MKYTNVINRHLFFNGIIHVTEDVLIFFNYIHIKDWFKTQTENAIEYSLMYRLTNKTVKIYIIFER